MQILPESPSLANWPEKTLMPARSNEEEEEEGRKGGEEGGREAGGGKQRCLPSRRAVIYWTERQEDLWSL